ncbi:hypothetical protein PZE19_13375 [Paludisphaera sp. Pla2]|uniref:Secreted protein n=1 Tax=Paludisphaera mucosa TaxID=3030827 RepID=A0ABT6FB01_9BACT|nr:hypothetical protein [Paludisphaera mucosa]MDG3004773.1 hypothetical protein [Paludisphaera mucosa]
MSCFLTIVLRTSFSIVSAIAVEFPLSPDNCWAIASAIPVFTMRSKSPMPSKGEIFRGSDASMSASKGLKSRTSPLAWRTTSRTFR